MEETLKRLKENLSEKDFIAVTETMRRKIKKGLLEYNLYIFEQTLEKLNDEADKDEKKLNNDAAEIIENEDDKLNENIAEIDTLIKLCEGYCNNYDNEIILSQLEREDIELMEGFKYE